VLTSRELQRIVDIAREHDLIIHSDEVYRPLFNADGTKEQPPSLLDLAYEKVIVTGSMSNAFSLAGIRVGWLASGSQALLKSCAAARDYTSISVSQIDDQIATVATSQEVMHKILDRNIRLAVQNKAAVQSLIDEFSSICSWTAPSGGTTAMIQIRRPSGELIDDVEFCQSLQERTGTMLVPASHCFGDGRDFAGHVRIGYVCRHAELIAGLEKLRCYLRDHFLLPPSILVVPTK
jgi:aspartate/methionine/tyrosine aminotransferase